MADNTSAEERERIAEELKELRDMHKLSIISDEEFERRSYFLLHPEQVKKKTPPEKPAMSQELVDQLKEIRDQHKLNIISDDEFEKRIYNILHDKK